MNMVENIRRIGIFMIAAQTVMHFAAGKQYEKYMKIIAGVIILLMFIKPFASSLGNPAADWQAEVERMEQQVQSNMQQEMPYVVNPVENVALQQIEEEIRKRLNDTISDQDCSVTGVVIDLERTGGDINEGVGDGERNWAFRRVKVTLQGVTVNDDTDGNENRSIRIEEIKVGVDSETNTEQQETPDSIQNAKIREYQQLFAQTLGMTDDKVEVTYHGGW